MALPPFTQCLPFDRCQNDAGCVSGECRDFAHLALNGQACSRNSECLSGSCDQALGQCFTFATGAKIIGQGCFLDQECASHVCDRSRQGRWKCVAKIYADAGTPCPSVGDSCGSVPQSCCGSRMSCGGGTCKVGLDSPCNSTGDCPGGSLCATTPNEGSYCAQQVINTALTCVRVFDSSGNAGRCQVSDGRVCSLPSFPCLTNADCCDLGLCVNSGTSGTCMP